MSFKLPSWFPRGRFSAKAPATDARDVYEYSKPSPQNAIDLLEGWSHAFPAELGVTAGAAAMYDDPRIHWAVAQFGALEGKRVAELGPLEGSHTYMLERAGAARIDAIEANKLAFLRCLVAREIYGLRRARFHLGDFVAALEGTTRYDLIVACGVLYHMRDPLLLLRRIAERTDALYLWTHYFDEAEMPPGDPRRGAFRAPLAPHAEAVETAEIGGVAINLHLRSYHGAWKNSVYCGGPVDRHYWLEKRQLVEALGALGFNQIAFAHEDPAHQNGPATSIFARRT